MSGSITIERSMKKYPRGLILRFFGQMAGPNSPKHAQNISQTWPKHAQHIPKTFPKHAQNVSKTLLVVAKSAYSWLKHYLLLRNPPTLRVSVSRPPVGGGLPPPTPSAWAQPLGPIRLFALFT